MKKDNIVLPTTNEKLFNYYIFIALLEDRFSTQKIIYDSHFFVPFENNYDEYYEILFNKTLDKKFCRKYIDAIILEKNLNRDFCEKIRESRGLRYFICLGFHEANIIEMNDEENFFKIKLSCENSLFCPFLANNLIEIKFKKYKTDKSFSCNNIEEKKEYEYNMHKFLEISNEYFLLEIELREYNNDVQKCRKLILSVEDIEIIL